MTKLKQDLNESEDQQTIYTIRLLFKNKPEFPEFDSVNKAVQETFEDTDVVTAFEDIYTFAIPKAEIEIEDGMYAPMMVSLLDAGSIEESIGSDLDRSQFWDVENGAEALDACSYQIIITDMFASLVDPLVRADILMDFLDIILKQFPSCDLVFFDASRKLMTYEAMLNNPYEGAMRIFWGGCNARFFNIEGKDEVMVDTIGMEIFETSDIQYHFKAELEVSEIITHAYNLAMYQFSHRNPIVSGDTVPGLDDELWQTQYENSLIQPPRIVLDVNMNEHAAGNRINNLKH